MDFPIDNYFPNTVTDADFLYRSLGTFWTSLFQEKETLKGYTNWEAEEITQRYITLSEVLNSYSVRKISVFAREKWKPLILYKSKFNRVNFIFEQNGAVFGEQPTTDQYYQGLTFDFGEPKRPITDIYLYEYGKELISCGVIADRIVSPETIFTAAADFSISNGIITFNQDIFNSPTLSKSRVLSEYGEEVTYVDNGVVIPEERIILWAYNANIDVDELKNNFGNIFSLNYTSSQFFKDILISLFNIYVSGPTVRNIKQCCASFMGTPIVLNKQEIVESVSIIDNVTCVVTDKSVYKIPEGMFVRPEIVTNANLYAGDLLTTNIEYYDSLTNSSAVHVANEQYSRGWWTKLSQSSIALSRFLFNGPYSNQLSFSTELSVVSLNGLGDIVFPVTGLPKDVKIFQEYINDTSRKEEIKEVLNLVNPGDTFPLIPFYFVMENFLRANTVFLYFDFVSDKARSLFFTLLPIIREQLPPYVYVILKLDMHVPTSVYSKLNDSITINFDSGDQLLNADGSNTEGFIEKLAPYGYSDVNNRLFELSKGIKKSSTEDLPGDFVSASNSFPSDAITEGRAMRMKEGQLIQTIEPGSTTEQYSNLMLIGFN